MSNVVRLVTNKQKADAFFYAQADNSDPFTYSRAMSHIKNGITDPKFTQHNDKIDCNYIAEPYLEEREFINSEKKLEKYKVTQYRNISRP